MFYKEKAQIQLKDIGKENLAKDRAILEILENAGTHHSDMVGYGVNDIKNSGLSWILLEWKVKVLERPKYGKALKVTTWGRDIGKACTYRDFEIKDEKNNLCVIATSKWALMDINTGKLSRITNEIAEKYEEEEKNVFNIKNLEKLKAPEEFKSEYKYKVSRRDIDLNNHMHNLYYLDLAYEALPEKEYEKRPFENIRIEYKKEIKLGDKVKCKYSYVDEKNIVTIYNEDNSIVHAIIILF